MDHTEKKHTTTSSTVKQLSQGRKSTAVNLILIKLIHSLHFNGHRETTLENKYQFKFKQMGALTFSPSPSRHANSLSSAAHLSAVFRIPLIFSVLY